MKPNKGPLQTAEHILAKLIEDRVDDAKVGVCRFLKDHGQLEILTSIDLRELDFTELQEKVNGIISQNLDVIIELLPRNKVSIDLTKVPESIQEIRIVHIGDFDKRPCRDPHVKNTSEIGRFQMDKVKRVGKDRYRINFSLQ